MRVTYRKEHLDWCADIDDAGTVMIAVRNADSTETSEASWIVVAEGEWHATGLSNVTLKGLATQTSEVIESLSTLIREAKGREKEVPSLLESAKEAAGEMRSFQAWLHSKVAKREIRFADLTIGREFFDRLDFLGQCESMLERSIAEEKTTASLELLNALETLVMIVRLTRIDENKEAVEEALNIARAAIAKAKGQP